MFFGSLFSAYVLLRAGALEWTEARAWIHWPQTLAQTAALALATLLLRLAFRRMTLASPHSAADTKRVVRPLWMASVAAAGFLGWKVWDYAALVGAGMHPADDLALACWFVLTGVHWLHVAAGLCANVWAMRSVTARPAAHVVERLYALGLYWAFVDLVWIAILLSVWL
jgi:heme/copper-type cytochrome/quinol oxidase subunit 3